MLLDFKNHHQQKANKNRNPTGSHVGQAGMESRMTQVPAGVC